ncbi:solute carrier family 23 protein, partial [Escherichia coli]|uniref:solute carrier family 23 protein n=1 Tax=Escherichia coli TaxID=562 RepID=UPI002546554E
VNAFFTYTAVHTLGLSWQEALAAVFISGIIFAIAAFTPIARVLSVSIPKSLKEAITVGIGLFLAFIGLQKGGLVVSNPNTAVAMGKLSNPVVLATVLTLSLHLYYLFVTYVETFYGRLQ